jgi:hypothetical protein
MNLPVAMRSSAWGLRPLSPQAAGIFFSAPVLAEPSKHNTKEVDGGEARESTPAESCIASKTDSRGGENKGWRDGCFHCASLPNENVL